MTLLFTGASSPLGREVLRGLLGNAKYREIWCGLHHRGISVTDPRLKPIELHLEDEVNLAEIAEPLDVVIHFAGVTHTDDEQRYWDVNFRGTMRLAARARALGCRQFIYISSRCATEGSGAYGESKLAAERGLRAMEWDRLLILRPAEIYGAGGNEGVDKLLSVAARFHLVPLLWGHKELRFAPLAANDFVTATTTLIQMNRRGVEVLDLCGPEDLSAASLAMRIAKKYRGTTCSDLVALFCPGPADSSLAWFARNCSRPTRTPDRPKDRTPFDHQCSPG
jgi:nucleoside-diphosphate-sugar epimerase